jgi:hypothetical protein
MLVISVDGFALAMDLTTILREELEEVQHQPIFLFR